MVGLGIVANIVIGCLVAIIVVVVIVGVVTSRRSKLGQTGADGDADAPPWSVVGTEAARDWLRLFDDAGNEQRAEAEVPRGLRTETRCRQMLEQLLGRPFEKVRPKWLTNPETGRALELDCYCEGLKLAVEVSGQFHSVYTPFYHGTPEGFVRQLKRDRHKAEVCKQRGITLLTVPYWEHGDRMRPFLVKKLRQLGFLDRRATGDPLLDAMGAAASDTAGLGPDLESALAASVEHQRAAMRSVEH